VAEAEVEAVEHLAAAQLLQRRRHRSIRAAASASASPSEFRCGGNVEDGGIPVAGVVIETDRRWEERQEISEARWALSNLVWAESTKPRITCGFLWPTN
jgi:hypothetical protein